MDRKPFVSVNSVRAFLPPDSCAPTFHGGFRCFPGRRKTRTEVAGFTEGLTDIELSGPSDRIHALTPTKVNSIEASVLSPKYEVFCRRSVGCFSRRERSAHI